VQGFRIIELAGPLLADPGAVVIVIDRLATRERGLPAGHAARSTTFPA